MATTCTFKSYTVAPTGVTTEKSGTLSLNDVLVTQPSANNAQTLSRITGNTLANPSVVTVTPAIPGLATGDHVLIAGSNSAPLIDGDQEVIVVTPTTFSVAVNVTTAGTSGTAGRTIATVTANLQPNIYVGATDAATAGVDVGWYQKVDAATFRKQIS